MSMVTKVKFKALRNGKVIYKTLPIEHNFEVIPASNYRTLSLPEISIEYQVLEYLDTIDKREIMLKNEFDVILDYFIPIEKNKKTKEERILSFLEFATPHLEAYPSLKVPFRAIILDKTDELFGKSQTNEKIMEKILSYIDVSYKTANGVIDTIKKIFDTQEKQIEEVVLEH